ncbi:oxygen-independent coproporphyrinogen III oxidase [Pedobacter boryungensis]|uniref:Coproporphyrinogen-III oxidase n=1 Tax=Pedobacter boryungensis TaxID=869962 RepID=A0ABX2DC44_9SPHI|nr:oxygen-independent coproporphyrinogen III oxidase [Pedobacter boryungensis]NQX31602.1 oxygen-independent coproporphyrinogen III oxidase [Pedobacter boryungensis]
MDTSALLKKYAIAAPRYTSYPTVPYWETESFTLEKWRESLIAAYKTHKNQGISLYIHLPFCESLCTYCGCNTRITKNHGVEVPYIDALKKEWQMYCKLLGETPKIKELHLGGGTPTFFSPENLKNLIASFSENFDDETTCSFEGHPDNTTFEHLNTLHQLGFKRMSLGIQDFDPKVQMMINRFQTPEQVFRIMAEARELGYDSINFDLIYGLPAQTLEGLGQTMKEVLVMKPERIAFYSYAHVPWMKPGQRHYSEKDIPQGDQKFALYQLGRNMLINAGYQEIGMDHFALTKDSLYKASENYQLHRNFMGYTDKRTDVLIGLGVSSISDCKTAFSQNIKTVEEYLEQVNQGNLPVYRGHILNDKDLDIRQHILNLMCKGATRFSIAIPDPIRERLAPLLDDHLVDLDGPQVQITKDGMAFLRNICMAFDERLWKKEPSTSLFSQSV